jgi:SAM-dependent methyltransferase
VNHWLLPPDHSERWLAEQRYQIAASVASGFVLNWACGFGYGTQALLGQPDVRYVWGQDVDQEAINYAWRAASGPLGRCQFCLGDIESEPIPNDADWLVCLETLEHLADPATFLRRALRRVREGIVVSFPAWPTVGHNPAHLHDLTSAWLRDQVTSAEAGAWGCALETTLVDPTIPDAVAAGKVYVVAAFTRGPKAGPGDHSK